MADNNPITGTFGSGQIQIISSSQTFTIPPGVGKLRVRLWGGGGGNIGSASGGCGGGFAIKSIYDLTGITAVAVTVGAGASAGTGGTSSFGSFVSATGGTLAGVSPGPGTGVGGDINTSGGISNGNSTGCGSIFGNGGGWASSYPIPGASGSGVGVTGVLAPNGILGQGGWSIGTNSWANPTSGQESGFSIDFIGTGGGGGYTGGGINGGGGGYSGAGGYPGGGGGNYCYGAPGLVIVEY